MWRLALFLGVAVGTLLSTTVDAGEDDAGDSGVGSCPPDSGGSLAGL